MDAINNETRAAPTLYLIRHGETAWSLSGQHTGRSEIELTQAGERDAAAWRDPLAGIAFSQVFCSPRLRARRTAVLAGFDAPTIEPDLAEWDYGDDEGLTTREIRAREPGWDLWRDGARGGETPAAVSARADRLIARLAALSGNLLLFSHGHFSCAFAARWLGLPIAEGAHLVLDPAGLGQLGEVARHPGTRALLRWNVSTRWPGAGDRRGA